MHFFHYTKYVDSNYTQGACPLVDAATPSSDAAATTTAVDKTDHLRRPPRGEPAGGRWFVESNDDDDDDGQENVQHVPSGLVMKLSGRLLYFHPVQENMYWNIHGQPVDTSVLADKKLLRELHVDLIPILPQKTSSSSSSPGVDNDDDDDDDDDDVVELDDSNECRPVGTLAGGTWFLETNGDPTTVDRWLYRESDRVYYTREGIRVIPDPESTLRPIKRIVNGKVATQHIDADHSLADLGTKNLTAEDAAYKLSIVERAVSDQAIGNANETSSCSTNIVRASQSKKGDGTTSSSVTQNHLG